MQPSFQDPSSDVSAIAKNRIKNRVDRLQKAFETVRNELYPQLPRPRYHWYRRVIARSSGFRTLFALEQAVKRGDRDLLSRLIEETPTYRKGLSLALSDNFGVGVTSEVMSRLWPSTQEEGQPNIRPAVYVSGEPWGLFGPGMSQAQIDDLNRSCNGGRLPEFDESSKAFFRMIHGGKGHETDIEGGFRHRLFNEKPKRKG